MADFSPIPFKIRPSRLSKNPFIELPPRWRLLQGDPSLNGTFPLPLPPDGWTTSTMRKALAAKKRALATNYGQGGPSGTSTPSRSTPEPLSKSSEWILREILMANGVSEGRLPEFLKDSTVARSSAKDPLGQITVKRLSGLQPTPATAILKSFEEQVGGRDALIEALEAVSEKLSEEDRALLERVKVSPASWSLSRVVAEAGGKPSRLLQRYTEGVIALGRTKMALEVAKNHSFIVKDLIRNSLDEVSTCKVCFGSGNLAKKGSKTPIECKICGGTGSHTSRSPVKMAAMEKVLEIGKLVEKKAPSGPSVTVTTTQTTNVMNGPTPFMERMMRTSEEVLYGRREPIDVQAVEVTPELHGEVVGGGGGDTGGEKDSREAKEGPKDAPGDTRGTD